jgi:hypothetical protein
VGKSFLCEQFILDKEGLYRYLGMGLKHFYFKFGWNPEGWMQVLEHGSPEAQKLMATLPFLDPDYFSSELSRDPVRTVIKLSTIWSRLDPNVRSKIKIPPGYEESLKSLSELTDFDII